jgi:hypothetical protein
MDAEGKHHIRSLMLCVDLVGSRRIWAAHVGWVVDPDGSRRILSDRLDDQAMIKPAATSPPIQLGAQEGGQAAASPVGSTGYSDRQAFRPPWSASAWKPSRRSCSAARALVCSRGQVQYRT